MSTQDIAKQPLRPSRVWRLPAQIDTDQLAPGETIKHSIEVTAAACLRAVRADFASGVQRGDVIVAGAMFGLGSSREQAVAVLLHLGVAAVIAPSYSGLYMRNAFNLGLLLLTCAQAQDIAEGECVSVDARLGCVQRANGSALPCDPIPGFLLDMVQAGGLLPQLKKRLSRQVEGARPLSP